MRLHAALPRFRGDCSLSTLVYRIATRVVIDHWRGRPARMTPDLDFESEIAPGRSALAKRALAALARKEDRR